MISTRNHGWIYIPTNALIYKDCALVVMRDMGTTFSKELAYADFKAEMLQLILRTLDFQEAQDLIHGDIRKRNVAYDANGENG